MTTSRQAPEDGSGLRALTLTAAAITVATTAMTALTAPATLIRSAFQSPDHTMTADAGEGTPPDGDGVSLKFHKEWGWLVHLDKAHADATTHLASSFAPIVPGTRAVDLMLKTTYSACTSERGVKLYLTYWGPWCSGL